MTAKEWHKIGKIILNTTPSQFLRFSEDVEGGRVEFINSALFTFDMARSYKMGFGTLSQQKEVVTKLKKIKCLLQKNDSKSIQTNSI